MRIFMLLISTLFLVGFNSEECKKDARKYVMGSVSVSTTSFISSTGGCSMIGQVEHDKKVFIAQNFENLKIDSAKGGGEYINSYAFLAGCDNKAQKILPALFQNNFRKIYGVEGRKPETIYDEIEKVMLSNPVVSSGCYIQV